MGLHDRSLSVARAVFRRAVSVAFSDQPWRIREVDLGDRIQLVWISEHVGRKIALGIYEKAEAAFLQGVIESGDHCLDVGANVGYFTHLMAAGVGPQGRVVAVEPSRKNVRLIELNAVLNGTDDIVSVMNVAAAEADDLVLEMALRGESATSHVRGLAGEAADMDERPDAMRSKTRLAAVPAASIDSLVENLDLPGVDVVKMDIEGFELRALRGMRRLLGDRQRRPRLMMIEVVDRFLRHYGDSSPELLSFLSSFGYLPHVLAGSGGLRPYEPDGDADRSNVYFTTAGE